MFLGKVLLTVLLMMSRALSSGARAAECGLSTLPVIFLGHGGGPMPLLQHPSHIDLLRTWQTGSEVYQAVHDENVSAILIISAHHESTAGEVLIMADAQPKLLFDYGGFPPETYKYQVSNPGSPAIANQISGLLNSAGIKNALETNRGHDHGVFVPILALEIARKRPTLPILSISLLGPADYSQENATEKHFNYGKALASLRDEGVLIIGSGNSYHGRTTPQHSIVFDEHLRTLSESGDVLSFLRWAEHPSSRPCHPRPEHILPLIVCAGAASASDPSGPVIRIPHDFMGNSASHFLFR